MKRDDLEVTGREAQRLLDDPLLNKCQDTVRDEVVRRLEELKLDGTESAERYALELVRTLQANARNKTMLRELVLRGKIKEKQLDDRERKTSKISSIGI